MAWPCHSAPALNPYTGPEEGEKMQSYQTTVGPTDSAVDLRSLVPQLTSPMSGTMSSQAATLSLDYTSGPFSMPQPSLLDTFPGSAPLNQYQGSIEATSFSNPMSLTNSIALSNPLPLTNSTPVSNSIPLSDSNEIAFPSPLAQSRGEFQSSFSSAPFANQLQSQTLPNPMLNSLSPAQNFSYDMTLYNQAQPQNFASSLETMSYNQQFAPLPGRPVKEPLEVNFSFDKNKTRAETQIKVKLRLNNLDSPALKYRYIRFPRKTLAKAKLLASDEEKREFESKGAVVSMDTYIACYSALQSRAAQDLAKKRARGEAEIPRRDPDMPLTALPKEDPAHPQSGGEVVICQGCKEREQKRVQRKKMKAEDEIEEWTQYENDRVLMINEKEYKALKEPEVRRGHGFPPKEVDFNPPKEVEFNMRIACYCRHQDEKANGGYVIIFTFRDPQDNVLAQHAVGFDPREVFQITDDHKTRETPETFPQPLVFTTSFAAAPPIYETSSMIPSRRQSQPWIGTGFSQPQPQPQTPTPTPTVTAFSQPATTASLPVTPISADFSMSLSQPATPISGTIHEQPFFNQMTRNPMEFGRDGMSESNQNDAPFLSHTGASRSSYAPSRGPLGASYRSPPSAGSIPEQISLDLQQGVPRRQNRSGPSSLNGIEYTGVGFPPTAAPYNTPHGGLDGNFNIGDSNIPWSQGGNDVLSPGTVQDFNFNLGNFGTNELSQMGPLRSQSMMDLQSYQNKYPGRSLNNAFQAGYPSAPNTAVNTPFMRSRPASPSFEQRPNHKRLARVPGT